MSTKLNTQKHSATCNHQDLNSTGKTLSFNTSTVRSPWPSGLGDGFTIQRS